MRPIKFRGKSLESGEWVYGYYTKSPKGVVYITPFKVGAPIKVDPETVGQWTGLLDSEGYKVYEGDIIESGEFRAAVKYFGDEDYPAFDVAGDFVDSVNGLSYLKAVSSFEVIGNIYDDPELLTRQQKGSANLREIKFRMWDAITKKYFTDLEIVFECLKQQIMNVYDHEAEGCVFEQYTGLKDIDGTEIYEGDILEFKNYPGENYVLEIATSDVPPHNFVSGLRKKQNSNVRGINDGLFEVLEDLPVECEVIGNIYENPELLNAELSPMTNQKENEHE